MTYEVTYSTVTGRYSLPSKTLKEAQADKRHLQELNNTPGHLAVGIKIVEVK